MSSYDIGLLLGYDLLRRTNKNVNIILFTAKRIAEKIYNEKVEMFDMLHKDDFVNGFCDGIQTRYKGQKIVTA